jgi:uncharacterized membrane protein YccC
MALQQDTKEAIKTALAMTIAYGIGLQMGWDRPYWAGFAVAFISLSTIGQSLNKGTLRMVGTVVGAIVALTLIGLFAQQRWLFILFLSLWLALCTYMNAGSRHQYFWFVAGFVAVIIAADGGTSAESAFSTAMLRMQQTGLGILAYSLVAILIWPNNSRKGLEAAAKSDAATRQKLFSATLQYLEDARQSDTVNALHSQEITGLAQVAQLLDAATTDSEEVRAVDKQWRCYQHATRQFSQTLAQWRENFSEMRCLPLQQLLPGMDAFSLELERRLQSISGMMDGAAPVQGCADIDLTIDNSALSELSHFHRAALVVAQQHMEQLDTLSQAMFTSCSAMYRFSDAPASASAPSGQSQPWVPDPDRLLAAGKIIAVMWLAFLAVVYIGDFPGGMGFLAMCGPLGIIIMGSPQMPVKLLYAPAAVSVSFGGLLYIFVMPQLSSFAGLGAMIFLATFYICYRYASPQQGLGRALGLGMLVTLISVSNQQTYNFLSVANTALMWPLLLLLLTIVSYLPYSPRPERALLRLLTRYFRSAEFLLSQPPGRERSSLVSRREAFHSNEVASLPDKLNAWVTHADPKVLGADSVKQLPDLVNSLQALSYRLQEMQVARSLSQSAMLTRKLKNDMLAWRERVIEIMQQLSIDPAYRKKLERGRLDTLLAGLENRIEQCLDGTAEHELSSADEQNFYRLLGAYRGTSEALLEFAHQAATVDWNPWYKERFA